MFTQYNLFKVYAIPGDIFVNFIHAIRKNYFDVPFHNFYHAVDVLQTVYSLLTTFECDKVLATPSERIAILLAALCHDLRHPGMLWLCSALLCCVLRYAVCCAVCCAVRCDVLCWC